MRVKTAKKFLSSVSFQEPNTYVYI